MTFLPLSTVLVIFETLTCIAKSVRTIHSTRIYTLERLQRTYDPQTCVLKLLQVVKDCRSRKVPLKSPKLSLNKALIIIRVRAAFFVRGMSVLNWRVLLARVEVDSSHAKNIAIAEKSPHFQIAMCKSQVPLQVSQKIADKSPETFWGTE